MEFGHNLFDIVLAIGVATVGWLGRRAVGRVDDACTRIQTQAVELRDTRQAIARIEGKLDMDPFPYTS